MSSKNLVLIGAGGHARACIDVLDDCGGWRILGLVGLPEELTEQHLGHSVIGTDQGLDELREACRHVLITVGQIESPQARERLYHRVVELGFELPTIVARDACVSRSATIGKGTIVMHGAIINAGAVIGHNCIVNTRALIEHDSVVEDHCHVSTGAILNGGVHVGAGTFIGSGSTVKQGVRIGRRSLVGMGVSVRHDQPDHARYVGSDIK